MGRKSTPRVGTKKCMWCQKEFSRNRQSASEWAAVKCCSGSCAAYWARYHKPKFDMPDLKGRKCQYCEKELVRREDEKYQSWSNRRFCNKVCAATGKKGTRPPIQKVEPTYAEKMHMRVIKDEELAELSRMYQRREVKNNAVALLWGRS